MSIQYVASPTLHTSFHSASLKAVVEASYGLRTATGM